MSANRHRKLYEQVRERVRSAADLGHETLPSGAEVFGHGPQTGRDAWLHSLYQGLDDEELDALADSPWPDAACRVCRLAATDRRA